MNNFFKTTFGIAVLIISVGIFAGGILFYMLSGGFSGLDVLSPKNTDTESSIFVSQRVGIEFSAPERWGNIKSSVEPCSFPDKFAAEYEDRPCAHFFITAPDLEKNPLVMASQSKLFAEHGKKRTQYYGDLFSVARKKGINVGRFIQEYCINEAPLKSATRCEGKTSPNGVLYVKVHQEVLTENPERADKKALYYLIYHPEHEFDSIIMSSEFFSEDTPLNEIEAELDALVSSIKFI